jgi:phenylacetate-coenzyme A ligase PaaK-like adenylate-forming protein
LNGTLLERLRGELERAANEPASVFRWRRDARLMRLVRFHYADSRNPAYRHYLERHAFSSIGRLPITAEGLEDLPPVGKDLLREGGYATAAAIPAGDVRFIVSTSGTTGAPTHVPHSRTFGRRVFGELYARMCLMADRPDLLDQPLYFVGHYTNVNRSTGTFAAFTQARELLGKRAVMGSTSDAIACHLQVLLGKHIRSTCSAPHFYLALLAGAEAQGVTLRGAALDAIIAGGAPLSPENRARLKDGFGLSMLRLTYVSSELGWMGFQIAEGGPYAIFADEYVIEVVDDAGRHVAPGERGRVLVTALGSDAAPLIRYANGDTARYLGYGGPYANFPLLDEFGREALAIIGDGKVSYEDLAMMPQAMAAMGAPVGAFQLARRLAPDGRDQIHLRVELIDPGQSTEHVATAAVAALRRHPHMDFHISDGELPMPIVETYAPGHLTAGRFKVPPYVDEVGEGTRAPSAASTVVAAAARP